MDFHFVESVFIVGDDICAKAGIGKDEVIVTPAACQRVIGWCQTNQKSLRFRSNTPKFSQHYVYATQQGRRRGGS